MLMWVLLYIASMSPIAILVGWANTKHEIEASYNREDLWIFVGLTAVWPITLFIVLPIVAAITHFEDRLKRLAKEAVDAFYKAETTKDGTLVRQLTDEQLKAIVKCADKSLTHITSKMLVKAKQEILDRAAEQHLLGTK